MYRVLLGCTVALTAEFAMGGATFTLPPDSKDFRAKRHEDAASGLDVAVASFRTVTPDGMTRLTYNVCNLEGKALIFRWPKPGFETGIANPLGAKKCAVYSRDVAESSLDDNSRLLYWQSGDSRTAQAFLGKESGWAKTKRQAVTWLYARGFGLGPDKPDQVKDVEIVVAEYRGRVDQQVNLAGRGISVALRVADADEKTLAQLRAQVVNQGRLIPAKEFVEGLVPEDRARLPDALQEGFILVVSNRSTGPTSAKLNFELGESVPAAQPVAVLDADNRVIWVAQYSTVRKN
jgi:hypothetical protein